MRQEYILIKTCALCNKQVVEIEMIVLKLNLNVNILYLYYTKYIVLKLCGATRYEMVFSLLIFLFSLDSKQHELDIESKSYRFCSCFSL